MKFIADRMLGRLARWMRAVGLDVYYDRYIDRSSLFRIAKDHERVILTRARNFDELRHIPPYVTIKDEFLEGQLSFVLAKFRGLKLSPFTRCMECNELLNDISKAEVVGRVPDKSYRMHEDYKICPSCGRIYWPGTHVERMKKVLSGLTS